jgi:hypothetical protein
MSLQDGSPSRIRNFFRESLWRPPGGEILSYNAAEPEISFGLRSSDCVGRVVPRFLHAANKRFAVRGCNDNFWLRALPTRASAAQWSCPKHFGTSIGAKRSRAWRHQKKARNSPMAEGLIRTPAELRDLLAFLLSQK